MKYQLAFLYLAYQISCGNPVYNTVDNMILDRNELKNQPRVITNLEDLQYDKQARVITIGEAHIDPVKHVTFSPKDQYEEDVEFVDHRPALRNSFKIESQSHQELLTFQPQVLNIERQIYDLLQIRTQDQKTQYLKGQPNALYPFLEAIKARKTGFTAQEREIINLIKSLQREIQKVYKNNREDPSFQQYFLLAKSLAVFIDGMDLELQKNQSLDIYFASLVDSITHNDQTMDNYAIRISNGIRSKQFFNFSQVNEQSFQTELENFIFFSQRKAKVMNIHRKLQILKTAQLTGDLNNQQNALSNLQKQLSEELQYVSADHQELMFLYNRMLTAQTSSSKSKKEEIEICISQYFMYPSINNLCKITKATQNIQFDEVFYNNINQILQYLQKYEASIHSILTQQNLIRQVQLSVSTKNPFETQQNMQKVIEEVMKNQKIIQFDERIDEFLLAIEDFKNEKKSENLLLQNIDNVLTVAHFQSFENMIQALNMESDEYMQETHSKINSEKIIEQKLQNLSASLQREFSSETSHQVELLMEQAMQYRQKTIKLAKIDKLLNSKDFNQIRALYIIESKAIKQKQAIIEGQLKKARNLLENIYVIPLESATHQLHSLEDDAQMEAISRFQAQMAKNYILTNERLLSADRITECIKELNKDLNGVVTSLQHNEIQLEFINKFENPTSQVNTEELKQQIKHDIMSEQEITIFDQNCEKSVLSIRRLLRNKQIDYAVRKIQNIIKYNDSFDYMISLQQEEIQSIYDQLVANKNTEDIGRQIFNVQELHQQQQIQLKNLHYDYLIRRVLDLGHTQDFTAVHQLVSGHINMLQNENIHFNNFLEKSKTFLETLQKNSQNTMSHLETQSMINTILNNEQIDFQLWKLLENVIKVSQSGDQQGSKKMLQAASEHQKIKIDEYEMAQQSLQDQINFLQKLVDENNSDIFSKIDQILDIYRNQVMVLTNDPLHNIFTQIIQNIANKNRFETNQLIDYMFKEFNNTVNQIWSHINTASKDQDEKQYYSTFSENNDPKAAKFIQQLRNKRQVQHVSVFNQKSLRGINKQNSQKK